MLTNEKVLEAFREYLAEDSICEVVMTSRGYTVMLWEPKGNEWCHVQLCPTPEALRDELLSVYHEYLSFQTTAPAHEAPTPEQLEEVQRKCDEMLSRCE